MTVSLVSPATWFLVSPKTLFLVTCGIVPCVTYDFVHCVIYDIALTFQISHHPSLQMTPMAKDYHGYLYKPTGTTGVYQTVILVLFYFLYQGYVQTLHQAQCRAVVNELTGGNRATPTTPGTHPPLTRAGIVFLKKVGDYVKKGNTRVIRRVVTFVLVSSKYAKSSSILHTFKIIINFLLKDQSCVSY